MTSELKQLRDDGSLQHLITLEGLDRSLIERLLKRAQQFIRPMYAVQAAGCAPIVRAFERGEERAEPWVNAHTIAAGIRVPAAIGDFLILRAVRASGGSAIAVSDAAIEKARSEVATREGLLLCPEGAATYAAYLAGLECDLVSAGERVVLFNCASGVKYPMPAAGIALARPA